MQITSLLVEGGASVNWAFLKAGAADKIWFFYAPKILGGGASVGFAGGEGFGAMAEAAQVRDLPCTATARISPSKAISAIRTRKQ